MRKARLLNLSAAFSSLQNTQDDTQPNKGICGYRAPRGDNALSTRVIPPNVGEKGSHNPMRVYMAANEEDKTDWGKMGVSNDDVRIVRSHIGQCSLA